MTPDAIVTWLQIGSAGLLLAAIVLGYRRIWVYGWYADRLEKEIAELKQDIRLTREVQYKGLTVAEKVIDKSPGPDGG